MMISFSHWDFNSGVQRTADTNFAPYAGGIEMEQRWTRSNTDSTLRLVSTVLVINTTNPILSPRVQMSAREPRLGIHRHHTVEAHVLGKRESQTHLKAEFACKVVNCPSIFVHISRLETQVRCIKSETSTLI